MGDINGRVLPDRTSAFEDPPRPIPITPVINNTKGSRRWVVDNVG
jgi:hypothetical protein